MQKFGIVSPNELLNQGTKVEWNPIPELKVSGTICGLASNGAPVIGLSYIIELDEKIPDYPYTHATAFEIHLRKI